MINFVREAPGWLLAHPWTAALLGIVAMTAFASLILLNPEGRQVRNLWRRK
jgi:hypothetical protein